jgi:hypothetical protein
VFVRGEGERENWMDENETRILLTEGLKTKKKKDSNKKKKKVN